MMSVMSGLPWSLAPTRKLQFNFLTGDFRSLFNVLAESYRATLQKWGVAEEDPASWHRDRMPVLADLVATLEASPNPRAHELGEMLGQYAHGLYADLFN